MRLRTADTVDIMPSRRTLFHTSRTRSGRILAFRNRFLRANSEDARSVPTETNEAAVRTSTQPASNFGAGTSTTSISPPLTCWRTCFIFGCKITTLLIVRWLAFRFSLRFGGWSGLQTHLIKSRTVPREDYLAFILAKLNRRIGENGRDESNRQDTVHKVDNRNCRK